MSQKGKRGDALEVADRTSDTTTIGGNSSWSGSPSHKPTDRTSQRVRNLEASSTDDVKHCHRPAH